MLLQLVIIYRIASSRERPAEYLLASMLKAALTDHVHILRFCAAKFVAAAVEGHKPLP
jgi:hypothetical protein